MKQNFWVDFSGKINFLGQLQEIEFSKKCNASFFHVWDVELRFLESSTQEVMVRFHGKTIGRWYSVISLQSKWSPYKLSSFWLSAWKKAAIRTDNVPQNPWMTLGSREIPNWKYSELWRISRGLLRNWTHFSPDKWKFLKLFKATRCSSNRNRPTATCKPCRFIFG